MTERRRCDAILEPRAWRRGRPKRCQHPARFRQRGSDGRAILQGEYVCGRHVRPALMDNGDSVRKPWIVEPIAE